MSSVIFWNKGIIQWIWMKFHCFFKIGAEPDKIEKLFIYHFLTSPLARFSYDFADVHDWSTFLCIFRPLGTCWQIVVCIFVYACNIKEHKNCSNCQFYFFYEINISFHLSCEFVKLRVYVKIQLIYTLNFSLFSVWFRRVSICYLKCKCLWTFFHSIVLNYTSLWFRIYFLYIF